MKGYVVNKSNIWTHAMKRAVRPGGKIELDELYEQYGIKHGIEEGEDFISWLREVKLKDKNKWQIVLEDTSKKEAVSSTDVKAEAKKQTSDNVAPMVDNTKVTVEEIVGLSVRKAREVIPKLSDLKLLKYSLQEANQLANKDTLCIILRKRIKEIQSLR